MFVVSCSVLQQVGFSDGIVAGIGPVNIPAFAGRSLLPHTVNNTTSDPPLIESGELLTGGHTFDCA